MAEPPIPRSPPRRPMVRPILEYASAAWDPYQQGEIHKLEMVQRRAARFARHAYTRDVSVTQLLKDLEWEPLQERRLRARLSIFHQAVNNNIAIQIPDYITRNTRQTRHSHPQQFTNVTARKDTYKHSFFPRCIRAWNKLPAEIVLQTETSHFKTELQKAFREGRAQLCSPKNVFTQVVASSIYARPRLRGSAGDTLMLY